MYKYENTMFNCFTYIELVWILSELWYLRKISEIIFLSKTVTRCIVLHIPSLRNSGSCALSILKKEMESEHTSRKPQAQTDVFSSIFQILVSFYEL